MCGRCIMDREHRGLFQGFEQIEYGRVLLTQALTK